MKNMKILFLLFLLSVFIIGMYVTAYHGNDESAKEGFSNSGGGISTDSSCPNLLVKKGNSLLLYNTNKPIVDGENPIPFFTLDDYIQYLEIQRKSGVQCPILYLQQETNTQGQDVYRMRPSPFDQQGGLPTTAAPIQVMKALDANRDNAPFNAGNYPGFDPQGLHIGVYTDIDKTHDSTHDNVISDNPMDSNWAGVLYTQKMVDSGKYIENNVSKPLLFTANNVAFHPRLPTDGTRPPIDIL